VKVDVLITSGEPFQPFVARDLFITSLGMSNKEIALLLISQQTVKNHVTRWRKLE
jgi:DNA-binding NarL/FixJ family response regulator